jgi:hypothetical protein
VSTFNLDSNYREFTEQNYTNRCEIMIKNIYKYKYLINIFLIFPLELKLILILRNTPEFKN